MDALTEMVLGFIKMRGYLAGEDVSELTDKMPALREHLGEILTRLVTSGQLVIRLRKGQFVHFTPTF